MDTLSRLNLDAIDIENQMDRYISEDKIEFIPELQFELDALQKKIQLLQKQRLRNKIKHIDWGLLSS